MNTIGYVVYLIIVYIITVKVGWIFYRNGRLFILNLLHGDEKYTDVINKLLLVGYYLLNLGYCAITISFWRHAESWTAMAASLAWMIHRILIILGLMHYLNMTVIYYLSKKHPNKIHI